MTQAAQDLIKNKIDPDHLLVHKVGRRNYDRYHDYLDQALYANCGKVWAPPLPIVLGDRPMCETCFPKRPAFAIAA